MAPGARRQARARAGGARARAATLGAGCGCKGVGLARPAAAARTCSTLLHTLPERLASCLDSGSTAGEAARALVVGGGVDSVAGKGSACFTARRAARRHQTTGRGPGARGAAASLQTPHPSPASRCRARCAVFRPGQQHSRRAGGRVPAAAAQRGGEGRQMGWGAQGARRGAGGAPDRWNMSPSDSHASLSPAVSRPRSPAALSNADTTCAARGRACAGCISTRATRHGEGCDSPRACGALKGRLASCQCPPAARPGGSVAARGQTWGGGRRWPAWRRRTCAGDTSCLTSSSRLAASVFKV